MRCSVRLRHQRQHLANANTKPGKALALPDFLFTHSLAAADSAGDEIAIILQTMKLLLRVQT